MCTTAAHPGELPSLLVELYPLHSLVGKLIVHHGHGLVQVMPHLEAFLLSLHEGVFP